MNKIVNNHLFTFLLFFIIIFAILLTPNDVFAESVAPNGAARPMMLFLIDGLSADRFDTWIKTYPAFARFVKQSDLGMMTMRTGSGRSVHNQLLTMSIGIKMAGTPDLLEAVQQMGTHGATIPAYTDWLASTSGRVQVTLGEALQQHGILTEVIGSGDIDTRSRRLGALLLAERHGFVPNAHTEDLLIHESVIDPLFMVNDYDRLKQLITASSAPFLVVELGDIRRFLTAEKRLRSEEFVSIQKEIEHKIIDLILWSNRQFGAMRDLWIIAPGIDSAAEKEMKWMTPIVRHSPSQRQEAIFSSPTTRQAGIVANVDLFPTFLAHWGIPIPNTVEGRALERIAEWGVQQELRTRTAEIFYIHKLRPDLLYQVISMQVILLVAIGMFAMFGRGRSRWMLQAGHYLLMYVLMVPFLLLLLGAWIPRWSISQTHLYLLVGGALIAFVLRNRRREEMYRWISGAYIILLFVDGVLNNAWMKRSFLGYDPVIGARYYGIGNEYMGVLLGSGLLLFYLLYERVKGWHPISRVMLLLPLLLAILLYLALPNGGTNAGGTIAWLVALLLASRLLFPVLWTGKGFIYLIFSGGVLFSLFLWIHYIPSGTAQTHVGRLLHQLSAGNFDVITDTIQRKWEMNIRLIKVSTWSKLFVTSLVVLVWFMLFTRKRKKKGESVAIWGKAFRGIVWVSMVNLLVNDSGVVAAALSLLFAAVPLLHMVISERVTPAPAPSLAAPRS